MVQKFTFCVHASGCENKNYEILNSFASLIPRPIRCGNDTSERVSRHDWRDRWRSTIISSLCMSFLAPVDPCLPPLALRLCLRDGYLINLRPQQSEDRSGYHPRAGMAFCDLRQQQPTRCPHRRGITSQQKSVSRFCYMY